MGRYSARLRARNLKCRLFIGNIPPQNILDIGAGSGAIARTLRIDGHRVVALDVVDHGLFTDTPITQYDGKRLPFDNNSFDYSVLVFVLHHAEDYLMVLKEASRVSSKGVILLEDTPKNKLELRLWRKIDYFLNHRRHADIDEAHHEFSRNQLIADLQNLGLEVIEMKDFRTFWPVFFSYRHTSFLSNRK